MHGRTTAQSSASRVACAGLKEPEFDALWRGFTVVDGEEERCTPACPPDAAQKPSRPSPLLSIPPELLLHIVSYLSPASAKSLSFVSRDCRAVARTKVFKTLCWPPPVSDRQYRMWEATRGGARPRFVAGASTPIVQPNATPPTTQHAVAPGVPLLSPALAASPLNTLVHQHIPPTLPPTLAPEHANFSIPSFLPSDESTAEILSFYHSSPTNAFVHKLHIQHSFILINPQFHIETFPNLTTVQLTRTLLIPELFNALSQVKVLRSLQMIMCDLGGSLRAWHGLLASGGTGRSENELPPLGPESFKLRDLFIREAPYRLTLPTPLLRLLLNPAHLERLSVAGGIEPPSYPPPDALEYQGFSGEQIAFILASHPDNHWPHLRVLELGVECTAPRSLWAFEKAMRACREVEELKLFVEHRPGHEENPLPIHHFEELRGAMPKLRVYDGPITALGVLGTSFAEHVEEEDGGQGEVARREFSRPLHHVTLKPPPSYRTPALTHPNAPTDPTIPNDMNTLSPQGNHPYPIFPNRLITSSLFSLTCGELSYTKFGLGYSMLAQSVQSVEVHLDLVDFHAMGMICAGFPRLKALVMRAEAMVRCDDEGRAICSLISNCTYPQSLEYLSLHVRGNKIVKTATPGGRMLLADYLAREREREGRLQSQYAVSTPTSMADTAGKPAPNATPLPIAPDLLDPSSSTCHLTDPDSARCREPYQSFHLAVQTGWKSRDLSGYPFPLVNLGEGSYGHTRLTIPAGVRILPPEPSSTATSSLSASSSSSSAPSSSDRLPTPRPHPIPNLRFVEYSLHHGTLFARYDPQRAVDIDGDKEEEVDELGARLVGWRRWDAWRRRQS